MQGQRSLERSHRELMKPHHSAWASICFLNPRKHEPHCDRALANPIAVMYTHKDSAHCEWMDEQEGFGKVLVLTDFRRCPHKASGSASSRTTLRLPANRSREVELSRVSRKVRVRSAVPSICPSAGKRLGEVKRGHK